MQTIAFLVAALLAWLIVQVALTYITAKLLKVDRATLGRTIAVVLLVTVVPVAVVAAFYAFGGFQGPAAVLLILAVAVNLFPLFVYGRMYRTTWRQLLGFVGLQFLLGGASYGMALPMKWYAVEAFKLPTNSMAPTMSGYRLEGTCPECKGLVVMTVDEHRTNDREEFGEVGTCTKCGKDWEENLLSPEKLPGDRILVAKWYKPQRWDAVVFRYPLEPSTPYLKRIVGMPGEQIIIDDDGLLLIDGKKLTPPPEFPDLRYANFADDPRMADLRGRPLNGTRRRPMNLGPDEYFVLGDNTYRALDSRFWGPVKRDAIIGTATMIHWPPSRRRIFK